MQTVLLVNNTTTACHGELESKPWPCHLTLPDTKTMAAMPIYRARGRVQIKDFFFSAHTEQTASGPCLDVYWIDLQRLVDLKKLYKYFDKKEYDLSFIYKC